MTNNDVYYRLYIIDGTIKPVCMQWFDEIDYDQKNFFTEDKYPSEEAAMKALDDIEMAAIRNLKNFSLRVWSQND